MFSPRRKQGDNDLCAFVTNRAKNILAIELTELFQVLHRGRVSSQVEKDVLQGTGMSVRQDKSIAIGLFSSRNREAGVDKCGGKNLGLVNGLSYYQLIFVLIDECPSPFKSC
jgi:hypothetical protein